MFVVIFRSHRSNQDDDRYDEWSQRLSASVTEVDGYVSHISSRDPSTRAGVTIAYFQTEEAIRQWREFPDHLTAQQLGRDSFYLDYSIEVAEIIRTYSWAKGSVD